MRLTQTYPNTNTDPILDQDTDLDDPIDPDGYTVENDEADSRDSVNSKENPNDLNGEYVNLISSVSLDSELRFDLENIQVARFLVDLIANLDLTVSFSGLFGQESIVKFDETLVSSLEQKKRLRNLVINKGGYLENEKNYFVLDKQYLTKYTSLVMTRNFRVFVFWRRVEIEYVSIQRIITLGFSFLIGAITRAELVFYVKENLPKGIFEVSVVYEKRKFVRIGVEPPILPP